MRSVKSCKIVTPVWFAFLLTFISALATAQDYVLANNNSYPANSVSVFQISNASLINVSTVETNGEGFGGATELSGATQSIAEDGKNTCVFVGNGYSGTISAMKVIDAKPYLQVVDTYASPPGGSGPFFSIGITVSNGYLYVYNIGSAFAPPTMDVWRITPGCTLTLSGGYPNVRGLGEGAIDSMAVTPNGKFLIATYGDGSVGSYAIGGGSFSLVSQELIAGLRVGQGAFAVSVAISSNGQWAIFGDEPVGYYGTTQLDVANIDSNGVLAPTTSYGGTGSLGQGTDTNGIALSPDNRFVYVVGLYLQETTVSFNATTGVITYPNGCLTTLHGSYGFAASSQPALVTNSGAGRGIYISEQGTYGSPDSYIALLGVNSHTGCATEATDSPFTDPNGSNMSSISSYSR